MRESCRILAAALLGLLCSACSVTRHIPEGQYFLQKVKIEDDRSTPRKERITASDMEKYVRQTPNKRFLGTNFYAKKCENILSDILASFTVTSY